MAAIQTPFAYLPYPGLINTLMQGGGESALPRGFTQDIATLVSGDIQLTYFTAQRTETIGHVFTETGDAASGLTVAEIGVYSVASNGNLTLIPATVVSDLTLWTSAFAIYERALTSSWLKTQGQQYALAVLAVGTTPPVLSGVGTSYGFAGFSSESPSVLPLLFAQLTGQSSLPSSITFGSLGGPNESYGANAIFFPLCHTSV